MKKTLVLIVLLLSMGSATLLAQTDTSALKKDAVKSAISNTPADTSSTAKTSSPGTDKKDKKALEKQIKQAAQKRQADSIASVKVLKQTIQKRQNDSIAAVKTLRLSSEKNKKDSISAAKANLKSQKKTKDTSSVIKTTQNISNSIKPDTSHTVKPALQAGAGNSKTDSLPPQKELSAKELKKLSSKKNNTDSLFAKSKSKEKPPKVKSAKELKREAKKNDINNLSAQDLAKLAFKDLGSDTAIRTSDVKRADISFSKAQPIPLIEFSSPNIKFYHRYWRDIELQDPKNKQFATYHPDLIMALLKAIREKEITAYNPVAIPPNNPTGDAFTMPIAYEEFMMGLSDTSVVNILDKDGNITGTKTVPNPFTPEKITGYRIKEDVFYDKIRAKMVTRIVGIAPLVKLTLSNGDLIGIQPLFWIKFKDCRKVLVTIDIDPTKKIGNSMDDVFLQRRFYGKIVQESNLEGKRIKDYKTEPADQETEAKRIEQKITNYKKGIWNYTMLTPPPEPEPVKSKPVAKTKTPPKPKKETTKAAKP